MNLSFNHFDISKSSKVEYDGLLVCLGYESRASYFASNHVVRAKNCVFCSFKTQQTLAFDKNLKIFQSLGFTEISSDRLAVAKWIGNIVADISDQTQHQEKRFLVDISSMTRKLITGICLDFGLISKKYGCFISVDFVYSLAEYGNVPAISGPLLFNGPCLNDFGGWPRSSNAKCGVIMGIGYEKDLALAVLDDIEAADVWAFRPHGHDARYDIEIDKSNKGFFDEIPLASIVYYSIFDPLSILAAINSIINVSKHEYRLLIVPFGPKIFSLTSALAAMCHYPEVGIWRVSAGLNLTPVDRKASGRIASISTMISPA